MEKMIISLNQIRDKKVWHFQPYSVQTRKAASALEKSSYPLVQLRELVDKTARGFPQTGGYKSSDMDIPLLSIRNITAEGVVIGDNNKFVSPEEHKKLRSSAVQHDDVLVSLFLVEGSDVATVYDIDKPANLSSQLALLRLKTDKIDPRYLAAFLNSSIGRTLLFQLATGRVQRSLIINQLLDLYIPLPPLAEQQRLIAAINEKHQQAAQRETEAKLLREEANKLVDVFMRVEDS